MKKRHTLCIFPPRTAGGKKTHSLFNTGHKELPFEMNRFVGGCKDIIITLQRERRFCGQF
jgi:hypothetical protein